MTYSRRGNGVGIRALNHGDGPPASHDEQKRRAVVTGIRHVPDTYLTRI